MRSLPPLPTNRTWPRDPIALVCRYPKPKKRRSPRRDKAEEKRLRADLVEAELDICWKGVGGKLQRPSSFLVPGDPQSTQSLARCFGQVRITRNQGGTKRGSGRRVTD